MIPRPSRQAGRSAAQSAAQSEAKSPVRDRGGAERHASDQSRGHRNGAAHRRRSGAPVLWPGPGCRQARSARAPGWARWWCRCPRAASSPTAASSRPIWCCASTAWPSAAASRWCWSTWRAAACSPRHGRGRPLRRGGRDEAHGLPLRQHLRRRPPRSSRPWRGPTGTAGAYGGDDWTARVEAHFLRRSSRPTAGPFPVATGTAANALSLSRCMTPPYGAVFCHGRPTSM